MSTNKISALVVAHNEEFHLKDCLKSLNFADEIVVVLDKCTDKSKEIASKIADKIIEGSWDIEGARRNIGLKNCSNSWVFELDADERVSKDLVSEIKKAVKTSKPCRFIAPIHNYVGDRYVKYGWLRTFGVLERQTMHYRGYKKYHEDKMIHPTADIKGEAIYLKNPITHLVDNDISDMVDRFNRYTNWKAKDMVLSKKIKGNSLTNFLSFINRFIKSYFFKKGYKEGALGFLIALLASLYPLVSYLKSKELLKK